MTTNEAARLTLKIALPLLVLGLGFGAFRVLSKMRSAPPKKPPSEVAQPVEFIRPAGADGPAQVRALGTVVPAREVALQAEVTGRIEAVGEGFVPGGRVSEGDLLVQLDRRDYWLQIKQAQASVKRAEVALRQEESRKAVAEREWKLIGEQGQASARGRALALREPQIDGARAELTGARSALDQARLAYQRTTIEAPFNAVVRAESVDIGQIARPGSPLGTLIGSDAWWIQVSLPAAELRWLEVPGGVAHITQALGDGRVVERQGAVLRQLPDVDPSGLMARIIVQVDDPLGLADETLEPLLLGATVDVALRGRHIEGVVALPREALRADDTAWLVGPDERLVIAPLDIARRERDRVLVRGLSADARVVRSRISAPIAGMQLALPGADAADAAQRAAETSGPAPTKVAHKAAPGEAPAAEVGSEGDR